jgi:hypothetical protein
MRLKRHPEIEAVANILMDAARVDAMRPRNLLTKTTALDIALDHCRSIAMPDCIEAGLELATARLRAQSDVLEAFGGRYREECERDRLEGTVIVGGRV